MAWLELKPSGYYHVAFRLGDQKLNRSLKTKNRHTAEGRLAGVEATLQVLESGRLSIPKGVDIVSFVLSDGRLSKSGLPAPSNMLASDEFVCAQPDAAWDVGMEMPPFVLGIQGKTVVQNHLHATPVEADDVCLDRHGENVYSLDWNEGERQPLDRGRHLGNALTGAVRPRDS